MSRKQKEIRKQINELRNIVEYCSTAPFYDLKEAAEDIREIANNLEDIVNNMPLRNCEIGTPEEQEARFNKFCSSYYNINNADCTCGTCPLKENVKGICEFAWMQMPYKNEVK